MSRGMPMPPEVKEEAPTIVLLLMNPKHDPALEDSLRGGLAERRLELLVSEVSEPWESENTLFSLYFQTQLKRALASVSAPFSEDEEAVLASKAARIKSLMIPYDLGGDVPALSDVRELCQLAIGFFQVYGGPRPFSLIVTVPTEATRNVLLEDLVLREYQQLSWKVVGEDPQSAQVLLAPEDWLFKPIPQETAKGESALVEKAELVLPAERPSRWERLCCCFWPWHRRASVVAPSSTASPDTRLSTVRGC